MSEAHTPRRTESASRRFPTLLHWSADGEGRLVSLGDECVEFTGHQRPELHGRGWFGLVHPDEAIEVQDLVGRVARGGARERIEFRLLRADGEYRWIHGRFVPGDGKDAARGVEATLRDVTVRRRAAELASSSETSEADRAQRLALRVLSDQASHKAREALVRSTESYAIVEGFMEHSPLGSALLDADFRFLRVNETLAAVYGLSPEELMGRTVAEATPGTWPQIEPHLVALKESRAPQQFDFTTTGRARDFLCYLFPVDSQDGGLLCIGASVVDITERKRMEDDLRRANALKDEFMSLVSHELRTPLTTIISNARFLKRAAEFSEDARSLIDDLADGAQRLRDVVENMLVLARLEHDHFETEPVALAALIRRVVGRRPLETHDLTVVIPPGLPAPEAAETPVEMVIDNLLSNAQKYSPPATEVRIEAEDRGQFVAIRVLDRGAGLAPEEAERVFDRFYRAERFQHFISGAGIGLTVCKHVVQELGGEIWTAPRPGGGTEFGFTLPVAE